jgi:predicted PurR-regulated permease PerM
VNLEALKPLKRKEILSTIFGGIGFLLSFWLNSFLLFIGLTVFSGFIGYLLGHISETVDRRLHRYAAYFSLSLILFLAFIITYGILYTGCMAIYPYTAENIFTGQEKEFIYGGCGPRSHPWFYEMTNS